MTDALNTYGAILTFAVKLEEALQRYYGQAKAASEGEQAERFEDFEKKAGKRKQRLVAIRQENVTEIVLEPINGLNMLDYELLPKTPTSAGEALTQAIALERRVERFYAEAGPKLNVTEPRRAFAKFAQEAAERLEALDG
jgi:rubrerythrin